eukprot:363245-Chlamydomonas_euryale.AAC.6
MQVDAMRSGRLDRWPRALVRELFPQGLGKGGMGASSRAKRSIHGCVARRPRRWATWAGLKLSALKSKCPGYLNPKT